MVQEAMTKVATFSRDGKSRPSRAPSTAPIHLPPFLDRYGSPAADSGGDFRLVHQSLYSGQAQSQTHAVQHQAEPDHHKRDLRLDTDDHGSRRRLSVLREGGSSSNEEDGYMRR